MNSWILREEKPFSIACPKHHATLRPSISLPTHCTRSLQRAPCFKHIISLPASGSLSMCLISLEHALFHRLISHHALIKHHQRTTWSQFPSLFICLITKHYLHWNGFYRLLPIAEQGHNIEKEWKSTVTDTDESTHTWHIAARAAQLSRSLSMAVCEHRARPKLFLLHVPLVRISLSHASNRGKIWLPSTTIIKLSDFRYSHLCHGDLLLSSKNSPCSCNIEGLH